MRKIFFFFLLLFFVLLLPQTASAQMVENASESASINYDLAFPGILPDSPFYKIKVLRDKITEILITDPMKKIEFYLLQADKGISATAMLVDKHKVKLAQETALKAENNYTKITYEIKKLQTKPDDKFLNKLETASLKHQEVLSSLIGRVSADQKGIFETVLDFSKRNLEQVKKFQKKTFFNK